MGFTQDTTGSPVTADGTWQTLITGDNSGASAPAHYSLSIFPETFYQGDRLRVLVETFDENDSTWHYYLGKELGYSDIKYPTKFIDGNNSDILAGLVARWPLDSSLTDTVGNEDLTDNGSIAYSTTDKKEGTASATFDGSTDYLTTTNDEPFDFEHTDPFSISMWIKPATGISDADMAISKTAATTFAGYFIDFRTSNPHIDFIIRNDTPTSFTVTSTNDSIPLDIWTHVVCTYDGSSNRNGMNVYINGALDTTGTSSTITGTILNSNSFEIGARQTALKWQGSIDDVRVYNYELSANQVTEIFNSYLGLVTHINFDNQVEDQFGSNDGTWTGTELYGVGKIDRSGLFDGSSYVTLANESNFDFEYNQPFSITGWIKNNVPSGNKGVVAKASNNVNAAGWAVGIQSGTNIRFTLNDTSNNEFFAQSSISSDTWTHFACVYDGSSNQDGINIYINGALDTTGTSSAISTTILNSNQVVLGAFATGAGPMTGELDDVKIWDKELTSEEVAREYGTKLGEIFNVFLPKQKFRVKIQQYQGHFRNYDFILYEVA